VKAFNTIYFERLAKEGRTDLPRDQRLAIFVAGDDAGAKVTVSRLIEEIGFAPIDMGTLREGGARQQPGTPICNKPMTGAQAEAALRAMQ
jgi:predicted dinucleotide-binding enzyme